MTLLWNHTNRDRSRGGYGRCGLVSVWKISAPHNVGRVVSVPRIAMGQYFKAVNTDKKEYVCPWCVGGGAKLWEWAANPQGAIFTLLLRKSSGSGGGDYYGYRTREVVLGEGHGSSTEGLLESIGATVALEGQPIPSAPNDIVGRWAGDRVVLVGDYDSSRLWNELPNYHNISEQVIRDWNSFIDIPEMKLKFNPRCSCQDEE